MKSQNYYEILEIPKSATPSEVKKAYHKKALQYHPDKTGGSTTEQFKAVQEANTVLSDPEKRKLYDTIGANGLKMAEKFHFNEEMLSVLTTGAYVLSGMCVALWWVTACLFIFSVNLIIKMDYSEIYDDYLSPLRDLRDSSLFAFSSSYASNMTSKDSRFGVIGSSADHNQQQQQQRPQQYWSWSSGVFFPIWASYLALSIFCGLYMYFACRNIFWILRDILNKNRKRGFCVHAQRIFLQRRKEQRPTESVSNRERGAGAVGSVLDDIDGSCDDDEGEEQQRSTRQRLNQNGVDTFTGTSVDVKGTSRTDDVSTNEKDEKEGNGDEEPNNDADDDNDTTERAGQTNKKRRSVTSSISTIVNALGFFLLCVSIIYFSFGLEAASDLRRSFPVFLVKEFLFTQRATSSSSSNFFVADTLFDHHNNAWNSFFVFAFLGLGCLFATTLMKVTPSHVLGKIKRDDVRRRNSYDHKTRFAGAAKGVRTRKEYYDASVYTETTFPHPANVDVVSKEDSDEEAEEILEQKMGIPRKPLADLATHYLYCAWLVQSSRRSTSSSSSSRSLLLTAIQKYCSSACPPGMKLTCSRLWVCFKFAVSPFYLRYLYSSLWTYICWGFFLVLLKASLISNSKNHRQPLGQPAIAAGINFHLVFLPLYILFSARHLLNHLFLFSAPARWVVLKSRTRFPFVLSVLERVRTTLTSIVGANKVIRSATAYVSILVFGARAADCLRALSLRRTSHGKKGTSGDSASRTSSSVPSSSSERAYHQDERLSEQRARNKGEAGHAGIEAFTTSIPVESGDEATEEKNEDVEKLLDWLRGGGCEQSGSDKSSETTTKSNAARSFLIELVVRLYTIVCIARILENDRSWSGHLDAFLAQIFDSPLTPSAKFDEALSSLTAATIRTEKGFLGSVFRFFVGTPGMMRSLLLVLLLNGVVMLPLASCLCCCATAFVTGRGTSVFQKIWEKVEQHAAEVRTS